MSRYINIDDVGLRKTIAVGGLSAKALWRRIQQEPSIDIVRCRECVSGTPSGIFCGEADMYICNANDQDLYEAGHFCSYGERREP